MNTVFLLIFASFSAQTDCSTIARGYAAKSTGEMILPTDFGSLSESHQIVLKEYSNPVDQLLSDNFKKIQFGSEDIKPGTVSLSGTKPIVLFADSSTSDGRPHFLKAGYAGHSKPILTVTLRSESARVGEDNNKTQNFLAVFFPDSSPAHSGRIAKYIQINDIQKSAFYFYFHKQKLYLLVADEAVGSNSTSEIQTSENSDSLVQSEFNSVKIPMNPALRVRTFAVSLILNRGLELISEELIENFIPQKIQKSIPEHMQNAQNSLVEVAESSLELWNQNPFMQIFNNFFTNSNSAVKTIAAPEASVATPPVEINFWKDMRINVSNHGIDIFYLDSAHPGLDIIHSLLVPN
jgi:hypothetical protein